MNGNRVVMETLTAMPTPAVASAFFGSWRPGFTTILTDVLLRRVHY